MNAAILVISIGNAIGLILLMFAYFQTAALFEQMSQMLIAERDVAREEAKTLKAALFPQLAKMGQPAQPKPPHSTRAAAPQGPLSELFPPRIPWRLRFKHLVRQNNTTQTGRDRMAAAIKQETPNA